MLKTSAWYTCTLYLKCGIFLYVVKPKEEVKEDGGEGQESWLGDVVAQHGQPRDELNIFKTSAFWPKYGWALAQHNFNVLPQIFWSEGAN